VQLADGYAFHRKNKDQFIMQFRLPAVILDQHAAKPRSPKKLQISKASLFVIIDDSEYTLAALASQLTDLGFRYSTLSSKDQFFEFYAQNAEKITDNFIFLVDKNLRSVSGVELVKILIDKFNVSASNVIMMSGDMMHFEDEIEPNVPQDVLKLSKPLNLNDHIEVLS
jgi:DNA-binding NtrC family response regulator